MSTDSNKEHDGEANTGTDTNTEVGAEAANRFGQLTGRMPVLALGGLALVGLLAVLTRGQWQWLLESDEIGTTGVSAERINWDASTERLYRIVPDNGSSVSYTVEEKLGGAETTAIGSTGVMSGEVAVNTTDPEASRIGVIYINLEMLESDSALRDKRLRHDYLESTHYPEAIFETTKIEGLPAAIEDGSTEELSITGQLLVKETLAPVTFTGPATLSTDRLEATMSATVKMSDFDIGPINLSGLVHTADEVELTLDLVADRVAVDTADSIIEVASFAPGQGDYGEGDFAATVQPVLESNCVSCHTIGGPGHSTISLDTAGDAASIADGIATVVASKYMPPWPASDKGVEMEHDYSLDDDDIATIVEWAENGGGLDVAPETVLVPSESPFPVLEGDLEVAPEEAYVGSLDVKDDYRCLTVEVPDPEGDGTWVKGYQFIPDREEIVHHSIISAVRGTSRETIEGFDAMVPGPGFTCYARIPGLPGVEGNGFGGWTPGSQPRILPEGYAIYLPPGDFLVNQIHYHFDHENPPDQSSIRLDTYTSEEVAALEAAGKPLKTIKGRSYLTPAEGPCTPEESGPLCDRDTVLEQVGEKYGPLFAELPDGLIRRCGGTLEDYAKLDGTKFNSVCDVEARDFGRLYRMGPHMHEFGSSYRITLNPDTPEELLLVDIPIWSFEWQLGYRPVEDIYIEEGDVFRIECEWDRSVVHMEEPRYIVWSDGTLDEMCFSSVSVLPIENPEEEDA